MRKIKFENKTNGLSAEFSTDTPMMFLESFDGCSCGTTDIVYKPFDLDGQYFISGSLNPRTIPFVVNFGGKDERGYSRRIALGKWEKLQAVFAPGSSGVLTWTDGTNSRFIKVRCTELSRPKEILPFLFSASISVTADKPLWLDTVENVVSFSGISDIEINNDCGIAVPVQIDISAGAQIILIYNFTVGKGVGLDETAVGNFTIDCGECTVKNSAGELCSHLISVWSDYWYLAPGINRIHAGGQPQYARIRWRRAYAGVY